MDALLFSDVPLKGLLKKVKKRVNNLYTASSFDEYISLTHSHDFENVVHVFINKDSPSSQPFARNIREDYPNAYIVLVTDERDKRYLDAYFADTDITKDPSLSEIDSVFPRVLDLLEKSGVGEGAEVRPIGIAAPMVDGGGAQLSLATEVPASDPAVPAPALALATDADPVQEAEESGDLEVVKGGKGERKRRALNYLASLLARPEPAEAQDGPQTGPDLVPDAAPEPDPGGKRPRWYAYVTVGVAALVAAAVLLPKLSNNEPKKNTDSPAVTAPVAAPNETAVTQEDVATVEPGPICWYFEVIKTIDAEAAAAAAAAVPETDEEKDGKPVPVTTGTPSPEPAPAPAPAPQPNHAPTCSISGPSQVNRGAVVTLTASGSDPDGDPVTLSWTTRTEQMTVSGSHSFTVTVTDSHGVSSSCTKIVQVI